MMTYKLFGTVLVVLASCANSFAQSSFQGITPGASTRSDVTGVLGQPVKTISATRFQYNPPAGIARVEVEFDAGTSVVERLEVHFLKPISRSALIKQFNLPQQAEAKTTDTEGKLVEYFGDPSLLALNYTSADPGDGVNRISYYSRSLFASAVGQKPPDTDGDILNEKAISKPDPVYPAIAKYASNAAEREGRVTVRVLIDESGSVVSASAVDGPALLRNAAVSAARQARFAPTLLNGKPMKVSGVLTYDFVLK
jgi:TonB family protein